jgi:hypothetical protein
VPGLTPPSVVTAQGSPMPPADLSGPSHQYPLANIARTGHDNRLPAPAMFLPRNQPSTAQGARMIHSPAGMPGPPSACRDGAAPAYNPNGS